MTNKHNINSRVFFSDPEKQSKDPKHTNISMGNIEKIEFFNKDGHGAMIYTVVIDCEVNFVAEKRWERRKHEMSEGCLHATFTEADLLWKKANGKIR